MKNIPVMILMLLCVSAMLFATETSEKKHEIIFTGRAKNGDKFEFGIISARKISYIMKIPGVEKPAVRSESVEVTAKGALTFKKVNESGNPLSLELNVDVLYGTVNGKPINCNELTGKTVVAELSGLTPEFKLKAEVSHDVNADILGSENSKQSIAELSKDATLLLGIIFQPASNETLADTLGEKALLAPGDRWDINTQKFRNTLETRKININETALNAKAMLIGRTTFQEQETWKINLMIQTKNIPGYDFIFDAYIQIPTY